MSDESPFLSHPVSNECAREDGNGWTGGDVEQRGSSKDGLNTRSGAPGSDRWRDWHASSLNLDFLEEAEIEREGMNIAVAQASNEMGKGIAAGNNEGFSGKVGDDGQDADT